VCPVRKNACRWIAEHRGRLGEPHPVLPEVRSCLYLQ
jgi:hypothetical protein